MLSTNTLEALTEEFCKLAEDETFLDRSIEKGKDLANRTKKYVTNKDNLSKALPYALAGASALGTYGLMRKFKLHKNPALASLQKEMKGKKLVYQTDDLGKADRFVFGHKPTNLTDPLPKGTGVLNTSSNPTTARADVMLNTDLASDLNDKLLFDRIMNSGRTGSKKVTADNTQVLLNALRSKGVEGLAEKYPTGFVAKPRFGSMGKVEDLITDTNKIEQLSRAKKSQHIIQEKLPIKNEYRVHAIDGVPFTASNRRIKNKTLRGMWEKITGSEGGGAFIPAIGKTRKDMMKFVEDSHSHLNDVFKARNHTHAAYDVAELTDGSFRLIEANPSPGTIRNPIVARKLNRMVTGKWDRDVSGAAALGVGAGVGLGAKKIKDRIMNKD